MTLSANVGRTVIGGFFTSYNGVTQNRIARLNSDGSLDTSFNVGIGANNLVNTVAVQPDGKVLVGGLFTAVNGVPRNFVARLDADGSVDNSFLNGLSGANGSVRSIVIDTNGPALRILIGGNFTVVNGEVRQRVARLNADGSIDPTFFDRTLIPSAGIDNSVLTLALQPDGKVLLGGQFTMVNGQPRNGIVRLDAVGQLDTTFLNGLTGANDFVRTILVRQSLQAPGMNKIVIGGGFTEVNGIRRSRIAQLDALDGALDPTINFADGFNDVVAAVAEQPDGKLIIGGVFTEYNSASQNHLIRVHGGLNDSPVEGLIDFSMPSFSVSEAEGMASITLKRTGGLEKEVSVDFILTSTPAYVVDGDNFTEPAGNARDGANFGSVRFMPGQAQTNFVVHFDDNTIVNPTRVLNCSLKNAYNITDGAPQPGLLPFNTILSINQADAILSIMDNEAVVGFSVADYTVSESGGEAFVTVARTGGSAGYATVDFMTTDGTAVAGVEYTNTQGTLMWLDGDLTNKTFAVGIIDNTTPNADKTILLSLANPSNATMTATIGREDAELTILDDEFSAGDIQFSAVDFEVNERMGGNTALITVVRTNGSLGAVSVLVTSSDGSATNGLHYTETIRTLNWADGDTASKTFNVPILDDPLGTTNAPRVLNLTLSSPTGGAVVGTPNPATVTIFDNDIGLEFSLADYVYPENTTAIVTVVRRDAFAGTVTVDFTTTDGTATTAGMDYTASMGTLTFGPGVLSQSFAVPLLPDALVEPSERVLLSLNNPTGGATVSGILGLSQVTITDVQAGEVDTTYTPGSGANGDVNAVTVLTNGNVIAVGEFTEFDGLPREGIAQFSPDGSINVGFPLIQSATPITNSFSGANSGVAVTNTVDTGTTSGIIQLTYEFPVEFDRIAAFFGGVEIFNTGDVQGTNTVTFAYGGGGGGSTSVSFVFNPRALLRLGAPWGYTVVVFPNALASSGANGTINALAVDNNANPLLTNNVGKLLIGGFFTGYAGTNASRIARLNSDGSLDLSFAGSANNPVNALAVQSDGASLVGGEFTDLSGTNWHFIGRLLPDGTPDPTFDPGFGPDGAVRGIAVHTNLSMAAPHPSLLGKIVIVGEFDTYNGVARKGIARLNADGTLDTSFNPPAANAPVTTASIDANGEVYIGGEFTLLGAPMLSYLARLNTDGSLDGLFLPRLNDYVHRVLARTDGLVLVGGGFTVVNGFEHNRVARLNNLGGTDVTINFGSGANDAVNDIAQSPDSTRIVLGGDFTQFNETPAGHIAVISDGANSGTGVIDFVLTSYSFAENAATAEVAVRRRGGLSRQTPVSFQAVPPGIATAINGTHYSLPVFPNNVVTFEVGQSRTNISINLIDFDDPIGNADRLLELSLIPDAAVLPDIILPDPATVTIVDNDPVIGFALAEYNVIENGLLASIAVSRNGGSAGAVAVEFSTADDTAIDGLNYNASGGTLFWADGEVTNKFFTVNILDDSAANLPRRVQLHLTNAVNFAGSATIDPTNAVLSIIDDEFGSGLLLFETNSFHVNEGAGTATLSVVRTNGNVGPVSVQYVTVDGTATSPEHYTSTLGALVWGDGEVGRRTFDVGIVEDDGSVNVARSFNVALTNAMGGVTIATPGSASVVIEDNDNGLQFSTNQFFVVEGATNAVITVLRPDALAGSVSVIYNTPGDITDTATVGDDYTASTDTLVFEAGVTNLTFEVPIKIDDLVEPNETLALSLTLPGAGSGGAALSMDLARATLTIIDQQAGDADRDFDPGAGANAEVYAVALQTNGQFAVAGDFTTFDNLTYNRLALLNADGAVDTNYLAGLPGVVNSDGTIRALALENVGTNDTQSLYVGGFFSAFNGTPYGNIARLHSDGTVDTAFNAFPGANNRVNALAVQADGKVLVGGLFTSIQNTNWSFLARLETNGSVDTNFNIGLGPDGPVRAITVHTNTVDINQGSLIGKIVIAGDFEFVDGVARRGIARLNSDGTLDTGFNLNGVNSGASVNALAIDDNGNVVIGGTFTSLVDSSGTAIPANRLARLDSLSGALDTLFLPNVNDFVNDIALDGDDNLIIVGGFTQVNGVSQNRIARLTPTTGAIHPAINYGSGANAAVNAIVLQSEDEKAIIGGAFTSVNGLDRNRVARLYGGDNANIGAFEFASATYSVNEDEGSASITLVRRGGLSGAAAVEFNTVLGGTAVVPDDYASVSSLVVNFAAGQSQASATVQIENDSDTEPAETVNLQLSNPTAGVLLTPSLSTAVLTIQDDDDVLEFAVSAFSVVENAREATVTVDRNGPGVGDVSVDYFTTDGTATAFSLGLPLSSVHYTNSMGTLTWTNGETAAKTFRVGIIDNNLANPVRFLNLHLTNAAPGNVSLGMSNATLRILDNEIGPGVVTFVTNRFDVNEDTNLPPMSSQALITAIRTNGTGGSISVDFSTIDNSAEDGVHFNQASGTLNWADGEGGPKSFIVDTIPNTTSDGPVTRSAFMVLRNPTGGAGLVNPGFADNGGVLDTTLATHNFGLNSSVLSIDLQDDGKPIIGGQFTSIDMGTNQMSIARLNTDGTVDTSFNRDAAGANGNVRVVKLQPDGKVLIGGNFNSVNGTNQNFIARLNVDGSVDTNFFTGTGANGFVRAIAVEPDGQILIGGEFTAVNGVVANHVARLNSDGSLDTAGFFAFGTGANTNVLDIAVEADGKILIVGEFTTVNGTPAPRAARLNSDGSLDTATFGGFGSGADNTINQVELLSDGSIVVGGQFTSVAGVANARIARLNVDGSVDTATFTGLGSGPDNDVRAFAIQPGDGKIVIAGSFQNVNGTARNRIARLNTDGSLDLTFNPGIGPDAVVESLAVSSGGSVYIGGPFDSIDNVTVNRFARLFGGTITSLTRPVFTRLNIHDNDRGLQFSASTFVGREDQGTVTVTVERQDAFAGEITVDYDTTTQNGTALAGTDFTTTTGTLTFGPGVAVQTFEVPLLTDNLLESTETVVLTLSDATGGATVSMALGTSMILIEDAQAGSVDTTFTTGSGPNTNVNDIVIQADGNILVAGEFDFYNGDPNGRLALLSSAGLVNTNFLLDVIPPGGMAIDFNSSASGGPAEERSQIPNVGQNGGTIEVRYQFFTQPDQMQIFYDGNLLFDTGVTNNPTGGGGGGFQNTVDVFITNSYPAGVDDFIEIVMNPGGATGTRTQWNFDATVRPATTAGTFFGGANQAAFSSGISINSIALRPSTGFGPPGEDGRIALGGLFTRFTDNNANRYIQVNSDGTIDTSFELGATTNVNGANATVNSVAYDSMGRLYIGGDFTSVRGTAQSFYSRLEVDGSVDVSFNSSFGADGPVRAIAIQSDGKVLIGGDFRSVNGVPLKRLARLNSDGTLDAAFNDKLGEGLNDSVFDITIDPATDDVLVGGLFTDFDNGISAAHIARFDSTGMFNPIFSLNAAANQFVRSIAVHGDGRILLGGGFTVVNGLDRNRVAQLNADGTIDLTVNFGAGANDIVNAVAIQADGKMLIGGAFTEVDGVVRPHLARLSGGANEMPSSGSMEFFALASSVNEDVGTVDVTVVRRGGLSGVTTVDYATTVPNTGTAIAPDDYTLAAGSLSFIEGQVTTNFTVDIIDDTTTNLNLTVDLQLTSTGAGAVTAGRDAAVLTILDNDAVLGFTLATYNAIENGGLATISVSRGGGAVGALTVDFSTANGSAIGVPVGVSDTTGFSFTNTTGTLSWADGDSTNKTFVVGLIDDAVNNSPRTVELILTNAVNLMGTVDLGRSNAVLNILDNELGPGELRFITNLFFANENDALITVVRTNGRVGAISAQFDTFDGTATNGLHYTGRSGFLSWADGDVTPKSFIVPVVDDNAVNSPRTVNLQLSNPTGGATIGTSVVVVQSSAVTDGLVAYYPFNGNALDVSGSGNDGILSGPSPSTDRFGNSASAYRFDGIDDFIELPNSQDLYPVAGGEDRTYSVWISGEGSDPFQNHIISKYHDSSTGDSSHFFVGTSRDLGPQTTPNITGIGIDVYRPNASLSNDWNHLVVSYRGADGRVQSWLNGQLLGVSFPNPPAVSTNFLTLNPQGSTTNRVLLGRIEGTMNPGFARGHIDDLRIYNRALSTTEIFTLLTEADPSQTGPTGPVGEATLTILDNDSGIGFSTSASRRWRTRPTRSSQWFAMTRLPERSTSPTRPGLIPDRTRRYRTWTTTMSLPPFSPLALVKRSRPSRFRFAATDSWRTMKPSSWSCSRRTMERRFRPISERRR